MKTNLITKVTTIALLAITAFAHRGQAQPAPKHGPQAPAVLSPEVSSDGHIAFRLRAPNAQTVRLIASDIPGTGSGVPMTKGTNGVWETVIGPVGAGAYSYTFNLDGVSAIDPRNPATSETEDGVSSLVYVPGADFMDLKVVPHGAVSAITYYSTSLGRFRRMHVYAPPGYELGKGKYPTFYLLHGSGDNDETWTSLGRACFILDNLIAAKKAKPMLVVMPAGHTRARGSGPRPSADEFAEEFLKDIMPYMETHYRVYTDSRHRAIAGLSMGGGQSLNLALLHPDRFGYVGVFSAGIFRLTGGGRGGTPAPTPGPSWEAQHLDALDNPQLKKTLKLLWFSTGKEDFLIETSRATVAMLQKHGLHPVFNETPGAHTWLNWREYLNEFAPLLFQ